MAKKSFRVRVIKQFERVVLNENVKVKKGASTSASYNTATDLWRVAFKGRWINLGNTDTASEYIAIYEDEVSDKYLPLK